MLDHVFEIASIVMSTGTLGMLVFFKPRRRKENAEAKSAEIDNEKKHIDWLENRIAQRDSKVDVLYDQLHEEQQKNIGLLVEKHNVELALKEATLRRCDVQKCKIRQPPSEY